MWVRNRDAVSAPRRWADRALTLLHHWRKHVRLGVGCVSQENLNDSSDTHDLVGKTGSRKLAGVIEVVVLEMLASRLSARLIHSPGPS